MQTLVRIIIFCCTVALLSGCAVHNPKIWEPAKFPKATPATSKLHSLPPAGQKVAVAVYGFTDQTGQFKPTDGAQTLSRAVTQGATSILVKSLHEAGRRSWFTVIEREKLDNVLRERAVIREMRSSYLGEKTINPQALPPLLFAGVLFEGGIIGYDSNTKSGGSGARLLGIGGTTQYREDTVTVYLRAVSVKTGEVLSSVSMRKSIASMAIGGSAFRYVAFKELLELESGITYNEPDQLALQQTIEATVYALIMEGAIQDLWCFNASPIEGQELLRGYISDRDSIPESKVALPSAANGQAVTGTCKSNQVARSARPNVIRPSLSQQIAAIPPAAAQPALAQTATAQKASVHAPLAVAISPSPMNIPPTTPDSEVQPQPTIIDQTEPKAVVNRPAPIPEVREAAPLAVPSAQKATAALEAPAPKPADMPVAAIKPAQAQTIKVSTASKPTATDCAAVFIAREPLPEGYIPSVSAPVRCDAKGVEITKSSAALMSVAPPGLKPAISSEKTALEQKEIAGME